VQSSSTLFDRGSIFLEDKEGRAVSAATLSTSYTVAINPSSIATEEDRLYNQLSNIIDIDDDRFFEALSKKDDPYEEIAHELTKEQADAISKLSIDGVQVHAVRDRFYPGKSLAAHTVGFVAYVENDRTGRYGIERYYNAFLERSSSASSVNFFAEMFANVSAVLLHSDEGEGDVVTHIEPSVQVYLEEELEKVHDTWNSKLSGGIVMNPKTGAIYALSVTPTFDPNNFQDASQEVFRNPLVERVYEMGSIMKPLTVAAGLDSGSITAKTEYVDDGYRNIDGYTIGNFDGKGRGRVNMQEVLNQSLNTGVVFVVEEMGREVYADYLDTLHIGDETGIDLPGEVPGIVSNLESPRLIEFATASYGQGIALTPIATIRALSSLANDGVPVTPHVGKRIVYESGLQKQLTLPPEDRVFSEETSEEITRMLVEVVDSSLLGGTVAIPQYSVAAKTGTAQIAKVSERGYYDDRFLHSFFGYFPAYDPEFLIFLYTVEPKGVRYASQTLTHPFIDMVHFLINYYEVPPDR